MAHAIEVEALGKHYPIGSRREGYLTLRESLSSLGRRRSRRNGDEGIWALRDVDLTVEEGEVLGVIGPNGAGKTTLLKILTRITEPTTGVTRTRGRVGALLEVGTGFHPELTGRENVYLNGAILGMRRREIRRKFDEIVEFSEIERFIDMPVKHYSSGMHMRLAFAVAAHLEPEVLIVDEVLAVGDAMFQKKSLGKMGDVAREGRTVLFVSHNLVAVEALCRRAIWLNCGRMLGDGSAHAIVPDYLRATVVERTEQSWSDALASPGNDEFRLRHASVSPAFGSPAESITVRTHLRMTFEYWNLVAGADLTLGVQLLNEEGVIIFDTGPLGGKPLRRGLHRCSCLIPANLLNDGLHRVNLLVVKDQTVVIHREPDVISFTVHDVPHGRGAWYGKWPGAVRPMLDWSVDFVEV